MGRLETQFFAYCQMRGLQTVRSGDISAALRLTPEQERSLLFRLARNGWIIRLRRGLYLVPEKLPLGGKWMPWEGTALSTLMEDRNGRYQVCGPNAFNFWGFDEQIPNRVYAYNNRISGERVIAGVSFNLIKVCESRLGGVTDVTAPAGAPLIMGSKARTLVDAVRDWKRFNTVPRAYDWIRDATREEPTLVPELMDACVQFGNVSTLRRIGYVLAMSGVEPRRLRRLRSRIKSESPVALIPGQSRAGAINRKWGVIENGYSATVPT